MSELWVKASVGESGYIPGMILAAGVCGGIFDSNNGSIMIPTEVDGVKHVLKLTVSAVAILPKDRWNEVRIIVKHVSSGYRQGYAIQRVDNAYATEDGGWIYCDGNTPIPVWHTYMEACKFAESKMLKIIGYVG